MTYFGLDIGTRYIGVAVGQTITHTATPLVSLNVHLGEPDWKQFNLLMAQWHPDGFVIGLPQKLASKKHKITLFIKEIGEKIQAKYSLPVFWTNEDLTSVEAKARLFSQKGYQGLKKNEIDCYAAKLILEDWLTQNNHHS